MQRMVTRAKAAAAIAAVWLAALAPAQIQPLDPTGLGATQGPQGQAGQATQPTGLQQNLPGSFLEPGGLQRRGGGNAPDGLSTIWSAPSLPKWSGFPAFPSRLQGYGNYPLPADPDDPLTGALSAPLPAAAPEPPGWPSWVRLRARKPLPFATDVGLLVAQRGRTWFRASADEPFVPSMQHDKFASLPVGSGVEIRRDGACEVLLHQSTRVQAIGPTRLDVVALSEDEVSMDCKEVSFLRLRARGRRHTLQLPDGSSLVIPPPQAATDDTGGGAGLGGLAALFGALAPTTTALPADVDLRRVDEPSWYGGRVTITNLGGRPLLWRHAFGETDIPSGHRVTFFVQPPEGVRAALVAGDSTLSEDSAEVTCLAVRDTQVSWCGARLAVPAGASVRLQSLAGPIRHEQSRPSAEPTDGD